MKAFELRNKFLSFFEEKNHKIFPSDSLVPSKDPTLLFTSAGMAQFKDFFLGERKDVKRAASCQKCLRTGDLKNVGKTAYHHTFFEMLGNFSFGDYFKEEAIAWAWEFLTGHLGLKKQDLWVSVYENDEEAFGIWKDKIGISEDRIVKLGAKENFWPSNALEDGPNGPCGPCSEIFFDRGEKVGCQRPDCDPSCDCSRFVEMWNLVFTQFNRIGVNKVKDLPSKNIDTGMGLERVCSMLQGKTNNYEIDLIEPLIKEVESFLKDKDISTVKAISDHIRAVTFAISDGIYPSNEDRGYVIRRLLRRALWFGFSMGAKESFLYKIVPLVGKINKDFYPEVYEKKEVISNVVLAEEQRFLATLDKGRSVLYGYIDQALKNNIKDIFSQQAFKLYDTYGFPFELTESIAYEKGLGIDRKGFQALLEKQREGSRKKSKFGDSVFAKEKLPVSFQTVFTGYENETQKCVVKHMLKGQEVLQSAGCEQEVSLILDKTPFYSTSGGQLCDKGLIKSSGEPCFVFQVHDVDKAGDTILHRGRILEGEIKKGAEALAEIDKERRRALRRAHSATHLLQAALRRLLGEHVQQQGSLVDEDYLRFDFSHFKAVSQRELQEIEDLVNDYIKSDFKVSKRWVSLEQAKKEGALAFFEEKYEDSVRIVEVDGISKELCGGMHLSRTGESLLFVILNESSVSSGVRRIEALVGAKAYKFLRKYRDKIKKISALVKSNEESLENNIKNILQEDKKKTKTILNLRKDVFEKITAENILKNESLSIKDEAGVKLAVFELKGVSPQFLRKTLDFLKKKAKSDFILLGFIYESGKLVMNMSVTSGLVSEKGFSCKNMCSAIAEKLGGSGGGRADFGFAGAKEVKDFSKNKIKKIALEVVNSESDKS